MVLASPVARAAAVELFSAANIALHILNFECLCVWVSEIWVGGPDGNDGALDRDDDERGTSMVLPMAIWNPLLLEMPCSYCLCAPLSDCVEYKDSRDTGYRISFSS